MIHELRCPSRLQGRITDGGVLEVKCGAKHCGAGGGVVVLHFFDMATGKLVDTKRFATPDRLFRGAGGSI